LNTSMNVTDVEFAVCFDSLGSFSLTDRVGISPGRFRHQTRATGFKQRPMRTESPCADAPVTGDIDLSDGRSRPRPATCGATGYADARVFGDASDTPITQRRPPRSDWLRPRATHRTAHRFALPELEPALGKPARLVHSTA
jgi:hypothetical protein